MSKHIYMRPSARPLVNHEISNTLDFAPPTHFNHRHIMLNQESHIAIVLLGCLLGAIIAVAIGMSVKPTAFNCILLASIPVAMSYVLRQVYIYTLIHFKD